MKKKICTQCKEEKFINDFYFVQSKKYRMSECKRCFKARKNNYYYENKEECNKTRMRWYRKNKKRSNEKSMLWHRNHREITNLRVRVCYYQKRLTGVCLPFKKIRWGKNTVELLKFKIEVLRKMIKKGIKK